MKAQTHFVVAAVLFCGLSALGAIMAEKEHAQEAQALAAIKAEEDKKQAEAAAAVATEVEVTPERIAAGAALFKSLGCEACHSADGSMRVGPSMFDLYGKDEKLADGKTVKVDEAYIKESLFKPADKVVAGFVPMMPTFQGRIQDEDMNSLIAWMKSLK